MRVCCLEKQDMRITGLFGAAAHGRQETSPATLSASDSCLGENVLAVGLVRLGCGGSRSQGPGLAQTALFWGIWALGMRIQ